MKYTVSVLASEWESGSGYSYEYDIINTETGVECDDLPEVMTIPDALQSIFGDENYLDDAYSLDDYDDGKYTGRQDVKYTIEYIAENEDDAEEPEGAPEYAEPDKVYEFWESDLALYVLTND